jgi:ectoine hydroxylase-related dioxygenase (phytanoyl-CoA dioxygenase family)
MKITHVSNETKPETLLTHFKDAGAVIVDDLVSRSAITELRQSIVNQARLNKPGTAAQDAGWQVFHGGNTIRFTGIGLLTPVFFDLLENPLMKMLADALLDPDCPNYWLNTAQAMLIGPGEPAQLLHRDCQNWPSLTKLAWPNMPEVTISMILALDDVSEAIGATRVIPGSHLWQDYRRQGNPEDTIPAELSAGSALLYSGKVIHGGGENLTKGDWRLALHMSFVVGWLTPEEAACFVYPREIVANRSDRIKRLLGYRSYNPSPKSGGRLWLQDFDEWSI